MVSVMLYPCMFCVALSMDLFVCCPVWPSVYECQMVECAFTSPDCMQCCMSVSAVLLCVDVLSRGGI